MTSSEQLRDQYSHELINVFRFQWSVRYGVSIAPIQIYWHKISENGGAKKKFEPYFRRFFQNVSTLIIPRNIVENIFNSCSPLTPEQRALKNGMVMFKVQDEDFMGFRCEYISEAFVHFKDIPFADSDTDLDHLPQTKLFMSVPKTLGT